MSTSSLQNTAIKMALLVTAIDQLSKFVLLGLIDIDVRPAIEITPFFNLVMVWNRGISFGMLQAGSNAQVALLIGVAVMIIFLLLNWLRKTHDVWISQAIALIVGGALGNIIDRIRFGAVADFFDFHVFGWHWPAFNVADSAIFIGVVILCFESMLRGKRT